MNYGPNIKFVLLADCKTESLIFNMPMDINQSLISDMKVVFQSFKDVNLNKDFNYGKVNKKDSFLHYYRFPNKLFFVVNADKIYSETIIREFVNKIQNEIIEKEFLEYVEENNKFIMEIKRKGKELLLKYFEIYKDLDFKGDLRQDMNIDDIDISHYFIDNILTSENTEETLKEKESDMSIVTEKLNEVFYFEVDYLN